MKFLVTSHCNKAFNRSAFSVIENLQVSLGQTGMAMPCDMSECSGAAREGRGNIQDCMSLVMPGDSCPGLSDRFVKKG